MHSLASQHVKETGERKMEICTTKDSWSTVHDRGRFQECSGLNVNNFVVEIDNVHGFSIRFSYNDEGISQSYTWCSPEANPRPGAGSKSQEQQAPEQHKQRSLVQRMGYEQSNTLAASPGTAHGLRAPEQHEQQALVQGVGCEPQSSMRKQSWRHAHAASPKWRLAQGSSPGTYLGAVQCQYGVDWGLEWSENGCWTRVWHG
eukprot:g44874.t1